MKKHNIQRKRFNIKHFAKTVKIIENEADNGCGFPYPKRGERASIITKQVWYEFGNMSFRICGTGDGVKRIINYPHFKYN